MRPVIKVARRGYDIRTAPPKNLTIDTSKNQFKVYVSRLEVFDLNIGNNYTYEKVITHPFSYTPTVIAFVSNITENGGVFTASDNKFNSLPSYDGPGGFGYNPLTGVIIPGAGEITIRIKEPYVAPVYGGGDYFEVEDVVLRYLVFVDKNFE